MRILLTSADNPYQVKLGGKHIHQLLLEKGLKKLGVNFDVLYYNKNELRGKFLNIYSYILPKTIRFKTRVNYIESYLKNRIPNSIYNIINAHDVIALNASLKTSSKRILTLHGYFARESIDYLKDSWKKEKDSIFSFCYKIEKNAIENTDYIITVDTRIRDYITSEFGYPKNKISVVYNSIDTDLFHPISPKEQRMFKKRTGFNEDDIIILVARRLVKKNGVIFAVQAMKQINNDHVKMIVAGDGPEKEQIKKVAKGNKRIILLGNVPHDNILSLYQACDIVLVPSVTSTGVQEATSLTMLEGMSLGKIVVCSNIGGMKEIIKNNENGFLIPEMDTKAIAHIINQIIYEGDKFDNIKKNARNYTLTHHSYISHSKKIVQIYQKVLEE